MYHAAPTALLSRVHLFVVAEFTAAPLTSSTTSLHLVTKERFVMSLQGNID
jgi:hypothetical protein